MKNGIARTVGVYGEAFVQFELARSRWTVDAVGATALGIDLLAWKGRRRLGISVKARLRDTSESVTVFKGRASIKAMRRECRLRGVVPYVAIVVFGKKHNTKGYLLSLDRFLERYWRKPRASTQSVIFHRTAADLERYDADPAVIKFPAPGDE